MSSDRCNICGRGDRLQEVGHFGANYCIDCINVSEKRVTAPIVKSVEPTDDPRVVAKAYRNHKLAIGKPVADYDADGILCRTLERSADRIEALEAEVKSLSLSLLTAQGQAWDNHERATRLCEGLQIYASESFWNIRHPELDETAAQLDQGSEARRIINEQ